ncbi:MAG: ester cyclase [Geodermatophilaceae bacterium]
MAETSLQERREACVRQHMESENVHAFDVTMTTFAHPRYELIGTGDVYDGEAEVWRYYRQSRAAFPDQRNEIHAMHHAEDAIIVEFDLLGTHLGPLRGMPPTGRTFRTRMCAFFLFEGDRIAVERIYFDSATMLRQLGLAHDPQKLTGRLTTALTHPITVGSAYGRSLLGRFKGGKR